MEQISANVDVLVLHDFFPDLIPDSRECISFSGKIFIYLENRKISYKTKKKILFL